MCISSPPSVKGECCCQVCNAPPLAPPPTLPNVPPFPSTPPPFHPPIYPNNPPSPSPWKRRKRPVDSQSNKPSPSPPVPNPGADDSYQEFPFGPPDDPFPPNLPIAPSPPFSGNGQVMIHFRLINRGAYTTVKAIYIYASILFI